MVNSSVERFDDRILRQPADIAAADPGEASRARDAREAECAHGPKRMGVGAFTRAEHALRKAPAEGRT